VILHVILHAIYFIIAYNYCISSNRSVTIFGEDNANR